MNSGSDQKPSHSSISSTTWNAAISHKLAVCHLDTPFHCIRKIEIFNSDSELHSDGCMHILNRTYSLIHTIVCDFDRINSCVLSSAMSAVSLGNLLVKALAISGRCRRGKFTEFTAEQCHCYQNLFCNVSGSLIEDHTAFTWSRFHFIVQWDFVQRGFVPSLLREPRATKSETLKLYTYLNGAYLSFNSNFNFKVRTFPLETFPTFPNSKLRPRRAFDGERLKLRLSKFANDSQTKSLTLKLSSWKAVA